MILLPNTFWKPSRRVRRLIVRSGSLWATRAGDPLDWIVEAGDTLELSGKSWLVQPLGRVPCDVDASTLPTNGVLSEAAAHRAAWPRITQRAPSSR